MVVIHATKEALWLHTLLIQIFKIEAQPTILFSNRDFSVNLLPLTSRHLQAHYGSLQGGLGTGIIDVTTETQGDMYFIP